MGMTENSFFIIDMNLIILVLISLLRLRLFEFAGKISIHHTTDSYSLMLHRKRQPTSKHSVLVKWFLIFNFGIIYSCICWLKNWLVLLFVCCLLMNSKKRRSWSKNCFRNDKAIDVQELYVSSHYSKLCTKIFWNISFFFLYKKQKHIDDSRRWLYESQWHWRNLNIRRPICRWELQIESKMCFFFVLFCIYNLCFFF